jgi:hypothetical protein
MTVTKRIKADYNSILKAKWHFFLRRSAWIYLLSVMIIAIEYPLSGFSWPISGLIYYAMLLLLIIPLYFLSAYLQAKRNSFHADVSFSEQEIIIVHVTTGNTVQKGWDWIRAIRITGGKVALVVNHRPRMVMFLNHLSAEELMFFSEAKAAYKL